MPFFGRYLRPASRLKSSTTNLQLGAFEADGSTTAQAVGTIVSTSPNQPPVAVIASPQPGFSVPLGGTLTLDPTGSRDPEGPYTGVWTITGAGGAVRFTYASQPGDAFATLIRTFSPTIQEAITVNWDTTDPQGATGHTQVSGTVTAVPVPTSLTISPANVTLVTGGPTQLLTATLKDQFGGIMDASGVQWASTSTVAPVTPIPPATASQATLGPSTGTGTATITAFLGSIQGTCAVTVTAAAPGGPLYPNLPTGLSLLFEYDGAALPNPNSYGAAGMAAGVAESFFGNLAIVPESFAGLPATSALEITYYAGLGPGNAPTEVFLWKTSAQTPVVGKYYEAGWFTMPGLDFEGPGGSGQWKILGYWGVGAAGATNTILGIVSPQSVTGTTAAGVLAQNWLLDISSQNSISWRFGMGFGGNVGGMILTCGKRYRYEIYMQVDSAPGAGNGILRLWLTNLSDNIGPVKILDRNVPITTVAAPNGFDVRALVPVWGGGGPANKTRVDHTRFGRLAGFGA